uniref:Uncharacterized protein n=1 Tax=Panagrolaimus sp. JU765 TaxID=591449 RepID=A0AC34R5W6_9BILA
MKWIIFLSCFLFNIVDGAVNERFGKIDEEYGLSYVEGLNHYIYDPRIVSPYIDLKDNSGTIINAEGVMIQGEGGETRFELKYDHCAPNTKDVFYTCICFELKNHNPDVNNPFCDGRPLMAVCKRSDDSSKFYVVDDKGHRDVFSKDLYFDWSLKQLKVGTENHDLKFEKHLPLNGQTSRTIDINTEGIEGFRVFSSYR